MENNFDLQKLCVRDHIPLEQGLRRHPLQTDYARTSVRDHIPLEQGLRLLTS